MLNPNEKLFQRKDNISLILLLDKFTLDVIGSWRQTEGAAEEKIALARDEHLFPSLSQIVSLGMNAIRFSNETIFAEAVDRLLRIYDLGRFRNFGSQQRLPIHFTLPSTHVLIQLYLLGAYGVFRRRLNYLWLLLEGEVLSERNLLTLVWQHPHWSAWSNYDSEPNRFDGALKLITETPDLFTLFYEVKSNVTMSLCQFDFLVNFLCRQRGQHSTSYFTGQSKIYVAPIIESLSRKEQAMQLYGPFDPQKLAEFLRSTQKQSSYLGLGPWNGSDWPPAIEEFLRQFPEQKADKTT